MFKGDQVLGWTSHDSQDSTGWPLDVLASTANARAAPTHLRNWGTNIQSYDPGVREAASEKPCHCPAFLTPRRLEGSTGACSRKTSDDSPKPQEAPPASWPSLAECRLLYIQGLTVRSLECPFSFSVFQVEAVQSKYLPWWLLQAGRVSFHLCMIQQISERSQPFTETVSNYSRTSNVLAFFSKH